MEPGEYTFSTGKPETMTVVSGLLDVRIKGSDAWRAYPAGTSFSVQGESSFEAKVEIATSYLCVFH
jgi:uncharacterized protein YaiE (UPF0345 family)